MIYIASMLHAYSACWYRLQVVLGIIYVIFVTDFVNLPCVCPA